MVEENISQEFRLKNIDGIRNYLLDEIEQNELISKKQKTFCTTLTYIGHLLVLASTTTGCIEQINFALTSLLGIPLGITSSAIGLKICAIAAEIKTY